MVKKGLKVYIDDIALYQLNEAYNYIKKDSLQNAAKVKNAIFAACMKLALQPGKYPPDKNKLNNDGSYRAFTLHRYCVSYRVLESEIRILRIRHTSMAALEY